MKKYCIGLIFIVFIGVTVVPVFFMYASNHLSHTDIFTRPGWLYGLAFVTAVVAAYICEMTAARKPRKT